MIWTVAGASIQWRKLLHGVKLRVETTKIFKWVQSQPPASLCNVSHSIPKAVGSMEKLQYFEITFMQ